MPIKCIFTVYIDCFWRDKCSVRFIDVMEVNLLRNRSIIVFALWFGPTIFFSCMIRTEDLNDSDRRRRIYHAHPLLMGFNSIIHTQLTVSEWLGTLLDYNGFLALINLDLIQNTRQLNTLYVLLHCWYRGDAQLSAFSRVYKIYSFSRPPP